MRGMLGKFYAVVCFNNMEESFLWIYAQTDVYSDPSGAIRRRQAVLNGFYIIKIKLRHAE